MFGFIDDSDVNISLKNVNYTSENISNIIHDKEDLKILYLNVCSLRNKLYDVELMVNTIQCSIDIIVLTEIWITVEENKFFNFNNFCSYYSNRSNGYGGTAIFVRNNIQAVELFKHDFNYCQALGIKLINKNLTIISIYRSQKNNLNVFYEYFESYLKNNSRCIVVGDFNINLLDLNGIDTIRYTELVQVLGYVFVNRIDKNFATRSRNGIDTIIDHILTDLVQQSFSLDISSSHLSDHKSLLFQIQQMNAAKPTKCTKFKYICYDKIFTDPLWYDVVNSDNTNKFVKTLTEIVSRNMREVKQNVKNGNMSYITTEILTLIKERDRFFRYRNKFPNNLYIADRHKYLSKLIVKLIKRNKKNNQAATLEKFMSKPKELWRELNKVIFNRSSHSSNHFCILDNGVLQTSDKAVAECFNTHFASIPHYITKNFNKPVPSDFEYLEYHTQHPFVLESVTDLEVKNIIKELKIDAASGIDNISSKVIKYSSNFIVPVLTKIINDSFVNSTFPQCLKIAKVIPVHKSGSQLDLNNYRPISVLTTVSKIFEKALLIRLENFLLLNNVIHQHQYGFIKKSSTTSACLNLTDSLSRSFEKKQYCACLFLDIRKAFDTINPSILLIKLRKMNISDTHLNLFSSYLMNRRQVVQVNNEMSMETEITLGIPQGSILGPCLFNIYINDIISCNLNGRIQLYADDAVVVYSAISLPQIKTQIQQDLEILKQWFNKNQLVLNDDKTKYIIFENMKLDFGIFDTAPITYNSFIIERVEKYNYLGLELDKKLSWECHMDLVKKRILPYIFAINRTKNVLPKKVLLLLYNAHILSRLAYLNPIWSGGAQTKLKEIEILQKRALKYIIHVPIRYPTKDLFEEFTSFSTIIKKELIVLIYKIIHNQVKHSFEPVRNTDLHKYNMRRKSHFAIELFAKAGKNNVLNRGLALFNELPSELKSLDCIARFKSATLEHLKRIEQLKL